MAEHIATATTTIDAPREDVWRALTDPDLIAAYMFGSVVETDWSPGSPITWSGEYEGKSYQDKGEVLEVSEPERLRVTHFSPLSGQDDVPENYHHVQYVLADTGDATAVTLSQDGNGSAEEAEHSGQMWQSMLDGMKKVVEDRRGYGPS